MDIHYGKKAGTPTEYFCCHCGQLRLSVIEDKSRCGHCGNRDLITGLVGSLDKAALKKKLFG